MFRILPLVSIERAHVRQGMAFNLPLFATSPVSDLDCCRLLRVLQVADKCVYRFRSRVCREPHLVHRRLEEAQKEIERLIPRRTQSVPVSPEGSSWQCFDGWRSWRGEGMTLGCDTKPSLT